MTNLVGETAGQMDWRKDGNFDVTPFESNRDKTTEQILIASEWWVCQDCRVIWIFGNKWYLYIFPFVWLVRINKEWPDQSRYKLQESQMERLFIYQKWNDYKLNGKQKLNYKGSEINFWFK